MLNRNDDFMYTLFVPARASLAMPCFDQPNLKATFNVTPYLIASLEIRTSNGQREVRVSSFDRDRQRTLDENAYEMHSIHDGATHLADGTGG